MMTQKKKVKLILKKGKQKRFLGTAIHADTVLRKGLGLMFARKPHTLLFSFASEQQVSLHMFFVFFPIDVVFLDSNKKVVELKEHFKPWSVYVPKKKAQYVVEFRDGAINKMNIKVGDRILYNKVSVNQQ